VIGPAKLGGMAILRKRLVSALARNASSPTEYFQLPDNRVVALGSPNTDRGRAIPQSLGLSWSRP
jgi:K+ transporter